MMDPHRETFEVDLNDIYGMAKLLRNGPPRDSDVTIQDFFLLGHDILHSPCSVRMEVRENTIQKCVCREG